jgi:hypothetical protein
VIGPQQFLEFFLPYLFLNDIPVVDSVQFPNRLLAAQLGMLLVKRPPKVVEIAGAFLREPGAVELLKSGQVSTMTKKTAAVLSEDRFKGVMQHAEELDDAAKEAVAGQIATVMNDIVSREHEEYYKSLSLSSQLKEKERLLTEQTKKLDKAKNEVGYWRGQASVARKGKNAKGRKR